MDSIVGTRIHDEILALIDRAEGGVVLVSPFVKMWPELRRALARAVARGVRVELITRGPNGAPRDEDLAVFADLEAEIKQVPHLHLKAYLSEKEALHTSANLTREALDKALESSLLFRRSEDPQGWNSVCEIWHKTLDDLERVDRWDPGEFELRLTETLRARADRGDEVARKEHRYCISCGNTASNEADQVVCLRCRAAAIAADRDPDDVRGGRCARCNGAWRLGSVSKPFCDGCYRAELSAYARRPARWYVHGTTGTIEAWTRLDGQKGSHVGLHQDAANAVARRWDVLMKRGDWLAATLTAATAKPVSLWATALPDSRLLTEALAGVVIERVPTKATPLCKDLPDFPRQQALHVAFATLAASPTTTYWASTRVVAAWDTALPRHDDPKQLAAPGWLLRMMLAPRKQLATLDTVDPGRSHVSIDLVLAMPADLRTRWREAAGWFIQVLLSALHSYEAQDVRSWLAGAEPKTLDTIVADLGGPAPFGPAKLIRDARGQVRDVPHRSDRLAAIRVKVEPGDGWHVKAAVSTVKPLPVN